MYFVFKSAEDPYILEHKMNCDMKSVESWLIANKLTLNVKKTRYMFVGSQLKLSQIHDNFLITISVNNTPLERVVKYKSANAGI